MCGITGIISKERGLLGSALAGMNNLAKHRGPDDEGYVLLNLDAQSFNCAGGEDTPAASWDSNSGYQPKENIKDLQFDFSIGLGHRRLSILDLSPSGHLPMCDGTSNYWITYNGEVYNYIEIRNELIEFGYNFKTSSDTEVVLQAYIQWGEKCVEKFEGMFALAIVDLAKKQVFLARDVFGIKPLYYWVSLTGEFCFASEIKQFTAFPGWKATMNKPRAFDYLYYSLTDHTEETLFENVFQLKPANRVLFDLTQLPNWEQGKPIETQIYYGFKPTDKARDFEAAKQHFKKRFEESVHLHLRSDVPIGSALSGGLDSSAIVCEINKILKEEGKSELQKTFSAISDNPKYSEHQWMQEVIDFTGVSAHFVTPKREDVFRLTSKILWHMDEPYQSQSAFLGYHVFELAAKNGVKVLLNGQGADEYLSGYDEFRMLRWYKLFKGFKWLSLAKEFKFYLGLNLNSWFSYLAKFVTYSFPDDWFTFFSMRSKQFKTYSKMIPPNAYFNNFIHPFKGYNTKRKSHIGLALHQIYCSPLPRFLRWEDRNSMAHGVEARVPFLNKPLINFSIGQPLDYLDAMDAPKKLMVNALKELLPPAIFNRKDKKGFITAEEQWVKEDEDAIFENAFKNSLTQLDGLINKDEAMKYYFKLKKGEIPFDYVYWRLILLGMWIDIFKIEIRK